MIDIPSDFPRRTVNSSLSGAMPKLSVRLTAIGTYTNTVGDAEQLLAYENAENLAQFLKGYVLQKETEHPEWGAMAFLAASKHRWPTNTETGSGI